MALSDLNIVARNFHHCMESLGFLGAQAQVWRTRTPELHVAQGTPEFLPDFGFMGLGC